MNDQSKKIDINEVLKKIIEQYNTIRKLKKNELNIEKIELFTIFYRLYNLSIKYTINLINIQELLARLKPNTKKEIINILSYYYKYCQYLKEHIDIIKRDLEEKIKNSNSKNQKIIDFRKEVEESEKKDFEFKSYCAKYQYNFFNNIVTLNTSLVSSYSNKLQFAYDEIIQEKSEIINEYYDMFYENYIKLMEELDKVKNSKIIKDIDKIKKGLYVKKLKIDKLLTNNNFNKKIQANSIEIPSRIKNSITNLNQYNLPTLQSNLISEHKNPKEFNLNSETRKKLAEKLTLKLGSLKKEINALIKTKYPNNTKLKELTVNKLKNKINTLSVLSASERQKLETKLLETKEIENKIKLLTKKISSNYENLLPKYQNQNQNQNMNMNRLKELQLSSKIRRLSNKENKEFQELSKKQNNNLKNFLNNYQPENSGAGVVNNLPEINSAAGVFFTRNLNPAASKSA
jgi:hypothetical protein